MDENISSFLRWSETQLTKAGIPSPRLDSEILLAHTLKLSRTELFVHSKRILNWTEKNCAKINVKRRQQREPVSLITGHQEFWSLDFTVDKNVLTPRIETELLIETALNCISSVSKNILDLGTGSGVLAVIMAKEVHDCKVTAIEIDPKALNIAKENATNHGVNNRIKFLCRDLTVEDWEGPYSMILSNPPYIPSADIERIIPDVQYYEPRKALDGGVTGMKFYKNIIPRAIDRLEANGFLILEIGHNQAYEVTALLNQFSGFQKIKIIKDYSGYDRVVQAQKRNSDG
jgi:release factor glutamine methyltransferase